ncbi:MAG: class F sortase [Patescibacteria group bacterium]|jgi:LPXTG-site transpeptidase (sortase) family protein
MSQVPRELKIREELRTFAVVLAAGSFLFAYNLLTRGSVVLPARASEAVQTANVLAAAAPTKYVEQPARIRIPHIAVNAAIEHVALAKDGSMDIPKRPMNAAWYELGPRPGEIGSAVLAGHINWYNGARGVFRNLHKLKPGHTIQIQDTNGVVMVFVIKNIQVLPAETDATNVFHSEDGKAHLNIVTCGGVWDKRTKRYTKRLVVFADKQE